MKKLAVLFIVLLAAALPVMASDVTVSGELFTFAQYDFEAETASGAFPKAELNVAAKVDEFVTVKLELDSEGADWTGRTWPDPADPLNDYSLVRNVAVDDFRLVIDLGGALKLPVKVTWTVGYFDTYFTDWSYVSMSGWEFYYGQDLDLDADGELDSYGWDNALANRGPDSQGAWQLDIGVGPVTLHWWNDFALESMMVGLSGGFGPITGWLTYDDENSVNIFYEGVVGVELKYAGEFGDLKLAVPAFFRYDLADAFTWGAGVAVDYSMFHVAAGLEGDDRDTLDNIVIDASVAPMDGLKASVSAYLNLASANAFSGLAIEVRKSLGAANFILGYLVGGDDAYGIPIYDDNYGVTNGLYMGFAVGY